MTAFLINTGFFNWTLIGQLFVNGLKNGAIYALMALTVVIIYKTTGHLNFAQGEMGTLGAFIAFALMTFTPMTFASMTFTPMTFTSMTFTSVFFTSVIFTSVIFTSVLFT